MIDESGPKGNPAKHILEDDLTEEYTSEDTFDIQEYGVDIKNGEIYLFGSEVYTYGTGMDEAGCYQEPGVDFTMANKFIKGLRMLSNTFDEEGTLLVHMNTPGGSWTPGMAIYQAIRQCQQHVVILNYAEARSMSSLIALAADRLVMMPDDSRYMIHRGRWGFEGTGTQADTEYQQMRKTDERMLDIYVRALNREHGSKKDLPDDEKRAWLKAIMKDREEVYWNPDEAVDLGFAHEVFDGDWEKLNADDWED